MDLRQNPLKNALAVGVVAAATLIPSSRAQADTSAAEVLSDAVASAAEILLPSVVNISATRMEEVDKNYHQMPFMIPGWEDMFKRRMDEMPDEREATSLGSGFFISEDGYLLTNNHVIKDAQDVVVTTLDERVFHAEIVGTDPSTDVALLKVESDGKIIPAKFAESAELRVGELAIAVGNPFSNFAGTVTLGIISAAGRSSLRFGGGSPSIQDYIQTDAAINPGNSGGPLANIRGEVIGINSAISSPSGVNVGIGFAVPVSLVDEILDDLKEFGEVRRAFLGVNIQEVDGNLAEALGLDGPEGVLISGMIEDGPAAEAGLQEGDVIVEFNGNHVPSIPKLQRMVGSAEIGSKAEVVVVRDGDRKRFKVKLAKMDDNQQLAAAEGESKDLWKGLEVVGLDSRQAINMGIEAESGVVIVDIAPGSAASHAGLRPGYVIKKLGEHRIEGMSDYRDARRDLDKGENDRAIAVYVQLPGGGQRYFALSR